MINFCPNCGLKISSSDKYCSNCGFENTNSNVKPQSEFVSNSHSEYNHSKNSLTQKNRKNIALFVLLVNVIALVVFTFSPKIFVWGGKNYHNYYFNFGLISIILLLNIIGIISFWRTSIGNAFAIIYFITLMNAPNNFHYSYYESEFDAQHVSHIYTTITIIVTLVVMLKYKKYENAKTG